MHILGSLKPIHAGFNIQLKFPSCQGGEQCQLEVSAIGSVTSVREETPTSVTSLGPSQSKGVEITSFHLECKSTLKTNISRE